MPCRESFLARVSRGSSCEGFFVDPTVTAIAVTPATPSITQNKTQQMAAAASYNDGSVKDITSKAIWSTSDPSKATVSSTGLVTGVNPGSATISASSRLDNCGCHSGRFSIHSSFAFVSERPYRPNCSIRRNRNICGWR
jgi:Bacterial Ig-like domain (group 2)